MPLDGMGNGSCTRRRRNAQLGVYECYLILINLYPKYKISASGRKEKNAAWHITFHAYFLLAAVLRNQGRRFLSLKNDYPVSKMTAALGGSRCKAKTVLI